MNEHLLASARTRLGDRRWAWWVPGRIEVLGKHTDYGGGQVLTCATDLGMVIAAAPIAAPIIRVHSGADCVEVSLDGSIARTSPSAIYVETIIKRLERNFPGRLRGTEIVVASDLPSAAGLSSSSALLTGLVVALAQVAGLTTDPKWPSDLASWAACIENGSDHGGLTGERGVGTHGGAMDHTAIVGGSRGLLTHWSFDPARKIAEMPLPAGTALVVAVSGVVAEKTGAARERYNAVAGRARAALATWNHEQNRADRTLAAAVTAGATPAHFTDPDLRQRVEHFRCESTILVPTAAAALATGNLTDFAATVAHSQALTEQLLGNQVPETIALVALAKAHGGLAASAFGAGFGGAVWALVPESDVPAFSATWLTAYHRRFPQRQATVHRIRPGAGLHAVS